MSSFLANATPATYYNNYGQQSDYTNSTIQSAGGISQNGVGQIGSYQLHSLQDLSSSSSPPTTNQHLQSSNQTTDNGTHYYLMNDNQPTNLSNTPPSNQTMNSSNNGPSNSNSSSNGSLDQLIGHQLTNGQMTNTTPSNQYSSTAQLTPPPSVSEGSHQSPVLSHPSYRDYTELSTSNNSTPTTSAPTNLQINSTTSVNNSQQQNSTNNQNSNSTNQSPSHNSTLATNNNSNMTSANLNQLHYPDSMETDSLPSTSYTPSIHNSYHLGHQANSNQFSHHPTQNNAFNHQANSTHPHSQFANSQDGLINQHLHSASYHVHHAHLASQNQIQVQAPHNSAHPHLHPQLNALNVAVHVHQFNSNPSLNANHQTPNSYLPDNHLTSTAVSNSISNSFANSSNGFIGNGLLTPAQPFAQNGLNNNKQNLNNASSANSLNNVVNNSNSRNDSPLGPYPNLTNNASTAIGQSIVCDSANSTSLLLGDAHSSNQNGSGSSTPNNAANSFHSLMYHLNPSLSSNSPSPTLQQQSTSAQLHLAAQHHHLQNQFIQPPTAHSLTSHSQLHPQQLQVAQTAQQLIPHPGSLNHHLQTGQPFPQHTYTQLNNTTPNHLNQHSNPMHPMHFKMQPANSNQQMNNYNSPTIVNNQIENNNSRNSPVQNTNKQIFKWMQVKRSQPKTGKK